MKQSFSKTAICFTIVAALLLASGCSNPSNEKVPHNYSQLYALICKPVAEVCRVLEMDEEAVASAVNKRETYTIGTVEYAGFDWNVELLLEGKKSAMYGFQYTRHYDSNNIEQAAKDAVFMVEKMVKHNGIPGEYGTLGTQTAQQLQAKTEKLAYETARWELTDQLNEDMQTYFQNYYAGEEGENVQQNVAYVMDVTFAGNTESGVRLQLEYKLQFF